MNCGRQSYYAKDCRQSQSTKVIKEIINLRPSNPRKSKELKGTRGYIVKHFVFCYNNRCPVYEEAKYGASYWPQEPSPDQFRKMAEEDEQNRPYYGKNMHSNNELENLWRTANPYLSTDYNSLYDFNPEKETFSDIENAKIKSYAI